MIGPDISRIERAKEDRRIQLLKWEKYDSSVNSQTKNKLNTKNIAFGKDIIFLESCSRDDLTEVRKFLSEEINPNVTTEDGLTALHQCCMDNSVEMCNLLLEFEADVNATDKEGWTPLHTAAVCGNKNLCSILIAHGANLLAINVDGNMPYDLCDTNDTLVLIESEMLKKNITQSQIDEIRLLPQREMLEDVQFRLANGDPLTDLDSQGAAPIHVACACGYVDVTRFLLESKVSPELPDRDGWLPIHIAVCWDHIEIIELLVAFGADMLATTRSGKTVDSICDAIELKQRLDEIWANREQLQLNRTMEFSNENPTKIRKSNSVIRSSMRDKRKTTQLEVKREREIAEAADKYNNSDEDPGVKNAVKTNNAVTHLNERLNLSADRAPQPNERKKNGIKIGSSPTVTPKSSPNTIPTQITDFRSPELAAQRKANTSSLIPPTVPPRSNKKKLSTTNSSTTSLNGIQTDSSEKEHLHPLPIAPRNPRRQFDENESTKSVSNTTITDKNCVRTQTRNQNQISLTLPVINKSSQLRTDDSSSPQNNISIPKSDESAWANNTTHKTPFRCCHLM